MYNSNLKWILSAILQGNQYCSDVRFTEDAITNNCYDQSGTLVKDKMAENGYTEIDLESTLRDMLKNTRNQTNYSINNQEEDMYIGVCFAANISQTSQKYIVSHENANYANLVKTANNTLSFSSSDHAAEITVSLKNNGTTDIVANYICLFIHAHVINFILTVRKYETPLVIKPGGVYTTKITLF